MKNLIKIVFALAVMLGSYFLGYYQGSEKYSSQLKDVNEKLLVGRSNIKQLKDSINKLNKITNQNISQAKDTLKTKTKSSNPKNRLRKK